MSLKAKLEADLKQAMLQKRELERDVLRMVLAEFKRLEVQEGKTITPEIEQDVLLRAVKTRQQSIDEYTKAGRADLADKEKAEQAIVQNYLPKSLSEAETKAVIEAMIAELKIGSKKYKGQIDGKAVQRIAGELLP
jgi:uncharacterized protein YqeY